MIQAVIFDMDGTLVKTERLKALSYAKAAVELCPYSITEDAVLGTFQEVVGLPRRKVAEYLVEHFDLESKARSQMDDFGVDTPWQAFVQVRLNYYQSMIADADMLRQNQWPFTVQLLHVARERGCQTALATMSSCQHTNHVLRVLDLTDAFDFVATRDDVAHGKPDPEIYLLVAHELNRAPTECLVIEDSPSGVQAAVNAGMPVIGVGTPFTKQRLHEADYPDSVWLVDDPSELITAVEKRFTVDVE